jgi:hypothetical protein
MVLYKCNQTKGDGEMYFVEELNGSFTPVDGVGRLTRKLFDKEIDALKEIAHLEESGVPLGFINFGKFLPKNGYKQKTTQSA